MCSAVITRTLSSCSVFRSSFAVFLLSLLLLCCRPALTSAADFRVAINVTYPYGLVLDGLGNIWVANDGPDTVQRYSTANGSLELSYFGTNTFTQPSSLAIDAQGFVYCVDPLHSSASGAVIKFAPNGTVLQTFQPPSGNSVGESVAVAVNASNGHVFLGGSQLVEFAPNGQVVQYLTPGFTTFTSVNSLAYDPKSGVLYVGGQSCQIFKYSNGVFTPFFTQSTQYCNQFSGVVGLAVDYAGNVYSTYQGEQVFIISPAGQLVHDLLVTGLGNTALRGVAVDGNGGVWAADSATSHVVFFPAAAVPAPHSSSSSGAYYNGPTSAPTPVVLSTTNLQALVSNGYSLLYVGDSVTGDISEFTTAGSRQLTFVGLAGSQGVRGMCADRAGYFYSVASSTSSVSVTRATLTKFDSSGNILLQVLIPSGAMDVFVDPSYNVWVVNDITNLVYQYSSSLTLSQTLSIPTSTLSRPISVTGDLAGNLYISDTGLEHVVKRTPAGVVSVFYTPSGAGFPALRGLAVANDLLFIADYGRGQILVVNAAGVLINTLTNATQTQKLVSPYGLTLDCAGNLYAADTSLGEIVRFPLLAAPNSAMICGASSSSGAAAAQVSSSARPSSSSSTAAAVTSPAVTSPVAVPTSAVVTPTSAAAAPTSSRAAATSAVVPPTSAAAVPTSAPVAPTSAAAAPTSAVAAPTSAAVAPTSAVVVPTSAPLAPTSAAPPTSSSSGSLCFLMYSLPGNVDYPWSLAYSLQVAYNPTPVATSLGSAVTLLSGSGTRTYTNRFGATTTTPVTVRTQPTASQLYLQSTVPVESSTGVVLLSTSAVQAPGLGPNSLVSIFYLYNNSNTVADAYGSTQDLSATAWLSNIPGFVNHTIGAGSINSLAVQYATCQAPISFTNGLRPPTQPSASNGARVFSYSYTLSDGVHYQVQANLSVTTASAFATTQDALGNPYQTITAVTGTRTYTYLPTGATLVSQITGLSNAGYPAGSGPSQRFYPYSLLVSSPAIYTQNSAPYFDASGLGYSISPPAPAVGQPLTSATSPYVLLQVVEYSQSSQGVLVENGIQPVPTTQQQTYAF